MRNTKSKYSNRFAYIQYKKIKRRQVFDEESHFSDH